MSDSPQFDIINKAAHYNLHPSKIECVELAERLSFNAGNAFKYVFRRGEKGNAVQDLNKAIYYLNRERQHLEHLIRWTPHHQVATMLVNDHFTNTDLANTRKLTAHEPDPMASAYYDRIFAHSVSITRYIDMLVHAVTYVQQMIKKMENPS